MHTLHVCQSGVFCKISELHAISEHLKEPDTVTWLDLEAPDEREIALLRDEFDFHPLAIEDAVRDHERPKVDAYPSYYLFVFYSAAYKEREARVFGRDQRPSEPGEPQIDLRQLSLFVGKNFLVTIHRRPIPQVTTTITRWQIPQTPLGHHVSGILHALLDEIVDDYFKLMDRIVDWVEELEDRIFSRFREGSIQEIFALKKDLLLRRVVAPERDVLNVLLRQETQIFNNEGMVYMQDVYDHIVRVTDTIDTYRDLLSSALDSYLSLQSNQLNQLVKTLTLSSIILMACALIAGIYGMNFSYMPELAWPYGYPFALGLMLVTGLGLALYFRSRRWW